MKTLIKLPEGTNLTLASEQAKALRMLTHSDVQLVHAFEVDPSAEAVVRAVVECSNGNGHKPAAKSGEMTSHSRRSVADGQVMSTASIHKRLKEGDESLIGKVFEDANGDRSVVFRMDDGSLQLIREPREA